MENLFCHKKKSKLNLSKKKKKERKIKNFRAETVKLKIEIYNGMIAGSSKIPVEIILLNRLPRGKREETKVTIIRNEGGNAVIEPVDINSNIRRY